MMITRSLSPEHVEVFELDSDATEQRLRITVAPGAAGSPALYVLDPLFLFGLASGAVALLRVASSLTDGPVPDLTVVGIGYTTEDPAEVFTRRARDLTPTPGHATTAINLPPLKFGAADRFRNAIADEVIPAIESRYPVAPGERLLVGFSFGGLFVLNTLFQRPELFTGYLAGSPSLWWDDGLAFQWEQDWARHHDDLPVRLMLWVGANEQALASVDGDWRNERFPLEALRRLKQVENVEQFVAQLGNRGHPNLRLSSALLVDEYHLTAPAAGIMRGLLTMFDDDQPDLH